MPARKYIALYGIEKVKLPQFCGALQGGCGNGLQPHGICHGLFGRSKQGFCQQLSQCGGNFGGHPQGLQQL